MFEMADGRTYGDSCGIARALDVAGDRWALLVVRELLLGPKRFTDLRDGLPHVSPDVLAQRLRELERAGVVRRGKLPPPAGARIYELTEWGSQLEPVLLALGRWGSRVPLPEAAAMLSPDALAIALKTMFAAPAATDLTATYQLVLGEHTFSIHVADGKLEITRPAGPAPPPALVIETDPGTMAALLWHGGSIEDALAEGTLRIQGSEPELARFLTLFEKPVAADATA